MRYGTEHGFYELNPFPGCNQLVVSNHAFIEKEKRGKGYGAAQHRARIGVARAEGYDAMICTVHCGNLVQKRILKDNGWERVFSFFNRETEHEIEVWMRRLYGNR